MKRKRKQRVMAILMSLLMVVGLIPTDLAVTTAKATVVTTKFILDASKDLTAMAVGAATDGQELKAGTENYFTLLMSTKTKIDASAKTFDDAYSATQRINFGAVGTTAMNSLKFTTEGTASVKIWWAEGGDDNRQMTILNSVGTAVATTTETLAKNAPCISTLTLTEAGTFYLSNVVGNNYIFKVEVEVTPPAPVQKVSILDASKDLTAMAVGAATDGQELKAGTENYFTLLMSTKTKIDASAKTFDDAYSATQRINFGAVGTTSMNSLKFTTEGTASVKIWWAEGGDDNRQMTILNSAGTAVATTTETLVKNTPCISTLTLAEAGTYYLSSVIGNNYIFKVEVTDTIGGGVKPARKAWTDVTSPSINEISVADGIITVPFNMVVGYDGADKVTVDMKNANNEIIQTKNSSKEGTNASVTFTPSESGDYHFSIAAVRADEDNKIGTDSSLVSFVLPLSTPSFSSATSMGSGKVALVWSAVKEATAYAISYSTDETNFSTPTSVTGTTTEVSGLTVGTAYTFKVVATRGTDVSSPATIKATTTAEAQRVWGFSAFGQGVSSSNVSYSGSVNEGTLRLWSLGGKGKLVPANTDGLGFYYTKVNKDTNFTLTAKLHVNSWTYSNGQEGFGLMAADAVGTNGDASVFWNNSYMLSATKVEYFYDAEAQAVTTDSTKPKISMKIGVGAQEKKGVTLSNLAKLQASDTATVQNEFKTVMNTLESSCGNLGAGSYNLIGNATAAVEGTQSPAYTDITVTIKRDNTGYRMMFTDKDGNVLKKTYYDYDGTNLTQLDDSIYVGFFTSRNADVSVSDVSFTTINRSEDAAPELPETTYIVPVSSVTSTASTGISDYNLTFVSNSDGVVTVKDPDGNVIVDAKSVKANEVVTAPTYALTKGTSKFTVTYKPNSDYVPGQYQLLSSYDEITIEHSVTYKTYGAPGQSIWVSPTATSSGSGSTTDPMDIYTAVKYVQPGQTIVLKEGTYNLQTSLTIARGVSGTESNLITMVADPAATSRPVFDFGKVASGMTIGGDYWYLQGFDVTNSSNGQKGIQVAGKNNTLDQVNAYHNGNTGIQISRLLGTDLWDNWPANNLILNCTSYGNADAGYEDADGFAAKLTIAEGNVFRGCIAHNNADDGWDLFAKVESGTIGKVVIDNCIAYSNGVLEDGTNAGNGNGFKLGGSSMVGAHELRNSIAYNNKAKGIDSNSCPDIQVYNCTTFNNGSFNVALYTSDAKNTNFTASGILSFRTVGLTVREEIKLRGTQDVTKVINSNNYFWDQVEGKSVNTFSAASFAPASALSVQTVNGTAVFAPSLATIPTEASASWFTSLDTTIVPTRDADGSINMNGLLTLTASAPANVGARLIATPSKAVAIPVSVKTGDTTHLYFFFTLSIMSGAALLGLYFYDKKRKTFVSR